MWCLKFDLLRPLTNTERVHAVCFALHSVGLGIVAPTTLQIFVGTVKGQARVWDQVLKLTKASPEHSVWGPSPLQDCFIEVFLDPGSPPSCVPLAPVPLKHLCFYCCFHTTAAAQNNVPAAGEN